LNRDLREIKQACARLQSAYSTYVLYNQILTIVVLFSWTLYIYIYFVLQRCFLDVFYVQVNGVDLAEILENEVTITNLHSCAGPNFILDVTFSCTSTTAGNILF
jgi:hypothetical protein